MTRTATRRIRLFVLALILVTTAGTAAEEVELLADFAGSGRFNGLSVQGSGSFDRCDGERPDDDAIRWVADGKERCGFFLQKRLDIREYGFLRLRLRSTKPWTESIGIGFSSRSGFLIDRLLPPGPDWKTVDIALPQMRIQERFDARSVDYVQLISEIGQAFELEIDSIALVRSESGWRSTGATPVGEGPPAGTRFVVADFETAATSKFEAVLGEGKVVERDGGHVLVVTPKQGISVFLENLPTDIRAFRVISFRARDPGGAGRGFEINLGGLRAELPELGEDWKAVRLLIPEMEEWASETGQHIHSLDIFAYGNNHRLEIDDVELIVEGAGWRYTALERFERGGPRGARLTVADFEAEDALDFVEATGAAATRVEVKRPRGNGTAHALRFEIESGKGELIFRRFPRDLRPYHVLRFLARVDRSGDADVQVRLETTALPEDGFIIWDENGGVGQDVSGFSRTWERFELIIPSMPRLGRFTPQNVLGLRISRTGPITLYLDEIELVQGAGGAERTLEEEQRRLFGGTKKVAEIAYGHFRVFTTEERSDRRLAREFDDFLAAVRSTTGIPAPVSPIEVFILPDRKLWADPLQKKDWTIEQIEAAAGTVEAGALVTFRQDFATDRFRRELTKAILMRTVGSGSGAWLREGLAGLAARADRETGAPEVFVKQVRPQDRMKLLELLTSPTIYPGGQSAPELMAAAFVSYLLARPARPELPNGVYTLFRVDQAAPRYAEALEHLLGATVADLERDWLKGLDAK